MFQGEVFSCFSHPKEQTWIEGLRRTWHAKETFPGGGNLMAQVIGLTSHSLPYYKTSVIFLVHLVQFIFQINRPSSQLPDTFKRKSRIKVVCIKSAADKLETSSLSDSSLRRQVSAFSLKVLSMSGLRSAPGCIQKLSRANLLHSYTPPFWDDDGFVVLFWFFFPQMEVSEAQKTE